MWSYIFKISKAGTDGKTIAQTLRNHLFEIIFGGCGQKIVNWFAAGWCPFGSKWVNIRFDRDGAIKNRNSNFGKFAVKKKLTAGRNNRLSYSKLITDWHEETFNCLIQPQRKSGWQQPWQVLLCSHTNFAVLTPSYEHHSDDCARKICDASPNLHF